MFQKSLVLIRLDFFCIEIQRQFNYTTSCDHIYGAMALLGVVSEEKKTDFVLGMGCLLWLTFKNFCLFYYTLHYTLFL